MSLALPCAPEDHGTTPSIVICGEPGVLTAAAPAQVATYPRGS
jgi:hypothetical protein